MKKTFAVLLLLLPLFAHSQTFKSYGLSFSTTLKESGWEKPDTFSFYYHDKAYISSINFGLYGEFLSYKHASTVVDLSFKIRQYFFQYDRGSITDAAEVTNSLYFVSLTLTEKLKLDAGRWSFYPFGGVKTDIKISSSIDKDFNNLFEDSKPVLFGAVGGIGFSKRVSRFWRVAFELFYEHDLNKMYESSAGHVQNNGFGIRLSFGPFNPKTK